MATHVRPLAGELAAATLARLSAFFADRNHRPSPRQWGALAALAERLESMANGTARPRFYLSSLDPGVGKSQTLVHFIDVLLASTAHEHVGVLICVSRLSEVRRMVDDSAIPADMLSVITSDSGLNRLGTADMDTARVVITTQQMVERRLAERSFTSAGLFTFRGQPRAVRVWDEAFLPGQPLTLSADGLAFVLRRLTPLSSELREDVLGVFNDVDKLPSGATYLVPDFADKHSHISLNDALALTETAGGADDERAVLSSLWFISGKRVSNDMARLYDPGERMLFSRGRTVMTAQHAERFAFGLVELVRETGKYRRAQSDPGLETMIINERKFREQILANVPEASGNRLR